MKRWIKTISIVFLILIVVAGFYVYPLLDIITGYAAKDTCSCLYVANRNYESSKGDLDFSPINLASVEVNESRKEVLASVFGLKKKTAKFRKGLGCSLIQGIDDYNHAIEDRIENLELSDTIGWPFGTKDNFYPSNLINQNKIDAAFDFGFQEEHKTRAIVVVKNDKIVKEQYAKGFDKNTRQLGWSMTKNICTSLVGILVDQGKMNVNDRDLVDEWGDDERKKISIQNLLQMTSGLEWVEDYFTESEVVKMLFKEENHGDYAISKPLGEPIGEVRNYSSGTSNILSKLIREEFETLEEYWQFPKEVLFDRIGMTSAQMETDESGHYIMSSYTYATPRDWAKFGLLYLNNGNWNGEQVISEDWVKQSIEPCEADIGYGYNFVLNTQNELFADAPKDTYMTGGFNGQKVIVIPSEDVVIVRMGVSNNFNSNKLVRDILKSLK